ncbi:ABC transporter ATP-binding protein [Agathobacter rectalis]|jgi:multidrug ABC transporter, permease/ATP-binding protein|uniref:ABC transporter ATP-binding protein n=1 Tax=Agathobacter rectalis TaxID=39491 RepID=UPI002ECAD3D7|nr:ABC transporter ATP-binding protein [Agathobacter rectalis]
MKQILKYLREYKKECICAPLFKLLEASFELIVPLVMAAIIDNGITASDKPYIWKMGGVLVLLAAVGLVSSVTAQYFAAKAAVGFSTKLRHILFEKIESLSFSKMDTVGTSTLITRMTSDINQVQSGVNLVLRLFLRSPFIVFGAMAMAFTVNVRAAMVFVVTIPLLSIVVFSVMAASLPLYKKVQSSLDTVLSHTRENLEGTRVIRAFNKQNDEIDSFNRDNEFLTNMQQVVGRISALTNPLTFIIINIATIAVIVSGGKQVYAGILTQGEVVALVNYMSQILVELIKLANLIVQVTKAVACGNRIADVLSIPSKLPEKNPKLIGAKDGAPEVEFDHVCMTYEGAADETLTDISFTVQKGQTIGIIGGTGSGKSSLVNLIPRFYDATKGTIRIQGNDINDYDAVQLRDKIGVVMQKAVLFAGTIADNLRWGKNDATEEEMWKALDIAQATEVVKGKEGGLDYMIEQGGKNLSGGQKQRLTIARAVVKDPDILILDDSASALDFATDASLRAALKGMHGDKTIFIVSQRTSSIQFADNIIVLDDGQMVGFGPHEELLETCETYKEIYDSQFKKESDMTRQKEV